MATATAGKTPHKETSAGAVVGSNALEVGSGARQVPHFDKPASKNVTALLGKTAYLNCRVKNLGNKTHPNSDLQSL
ncbi:hypothetical protein B566_EDAN002895 [Ephemera danica]|nr:hypothetical protein B566_EDAN002895 [Ephemera danica]